MFTLLILTATLAAEPAPSLDDVARARGQAPQEHPAGHVRLLQGGRGLLPARRQGHHLPGRPARAEDDYQIYTLDLAPGARPKLVSTGKGKCTCSYYHPDGKSILFASTHLDPRSPTATSPISRHPAGRPTVGPSATAGTSTPHMDHLPGRPRRLEPGPAHRHARLRRRGELLARRQADHLHLVPRRRRRDLHHGRRRQEPAPDHPRRGL